MFFSKEFSVVQNSIINILTTEDRPMTVTELANSCNVTYQTIKNHLTMLLNRDIVLEAGKGGRNSNAMRYIMGNPSEALIKILWQGEAITIAKLMTDYASGDSPVGSLKGNAREIITMFCRMYLMSADNLEDPSKIIPIGQMKKFQAIIANRHASLKNLLKTYESMLENPKLWDPREIVSELMIKDPAMEIETARSIAGNILTTLENS